MQWQEDIEMAKFYAGAKRSAAQQARLQTMKAWNAKKLAAALPAWAKPKVIAPFKPQLSQRYPAWTYANTACECTRTAETFAKLPHTEDTAAYVKAWDAQRKLKPTGGGK